MSDPILVLENLRRDTIMEAQKVTIKQLREELKKANQRTHVISQRANIRLKALAHVTAACCPKPICDEDHGKGWCPIRRALKRKPELEKEPGDG